MVGKPTDDSPNTPSQPSEGIPAPTGAANLIDTDYVIGQDNIKGEFSFSLDIHGKVFIISAATILDNLDKFDSAKKSLLPEDGVLVSTRSIPFKEGSTVFDALLAVTKDQRVHMEYVSTPLYKSNYIEGIANIYEMDAGPLSGWMYKVNGVFPNVGCGRYELKAGDVIEWIYTCDLGRDIGGDWNEQNSDR